MTADRLYENLTRRKILIVDDEAVNRQLLGFILQDNYEPLYAENGKEAYDIIASQPDRISLILLDLMMPVMDGFELLDTLKADSKYRKIPVIVLTSDISAEVRSLNHGAADFIKKPYDMPEVILARIRRIIELSEDREIIRATETDSLSGLYTREYFYEYGEKLDRFQPDMPMDAIVLNIDHFHLINEIHGRPFADALLREIARLIRQALSETYGIACRSEGDCFYIYARHSDQTMQMIDTICRGAERFSGDVRINVRAGLNRNIDKSYSMERRFERANSACNSIRDNYLQNVEVFDEKMREMEVMSEKLINDVDHALSSGQLQVYYQPKYAARSDGAHLAGAEALIRWIHPEFGRISPGIFVPLFEKNGLIRLIDRFVWETAGKQIRMWKEQYGISVPVSVNVSRIDLYDEHLEEQLLEIRRKNHLENSEYHLEVTESAYADDTDIMITKITRLRELGFPIEMDDFGTGYSSLGLLAEMPIDCLKLDMSFVRHLHRSEKDYNLVKLVMQIAEFLNVPVIAEGVESEMQAEQMRQMGCDYLQGNYFSRPVPVNEFEELMRKELAGGKTENADN